MPLPPNWAGSCTEQSLVDYFEQVARVMPVMLVTAIGPGVSVPLGAIRTLLERKTGIVAIKDDICGPYGRRLASLNAGRWAFLSGGRKENPSRPDAVRGGWLSLTLHAVQAGGGASVLGGDPGG